MRIQLLNTHVDNLTMSEALAEIDVLVQKKNHSYVVTPNLDHIVQIEGDDLFKEIYDNADLILTDGKPLLWIAKRSGTPILEKISGADIFPEICKLAAEKKYSIYILGAKEGVAHKAAQNLTAKYSGLKVAGTYSPQVGFEKEPEEIDKIVNLINASKADILAVALGSPKGEKLIYEIRSKICASLSISIGATIDFEAGVVKRAPRWVSELGFEWLYRMIQEPGRLLKRYVRDAILIVPIIIKYRKYQQ